MQNQYYSLTFAKQFIMQYSYFKSRHKNIDKDLLVMLYIFEIQVKIKINLIW